MIPSRRSARSGFTIVELLIVIAIIGLLTTLVTISMTRAKQKANIAAVQHTLLELRSGIEMLAQDTGYWPGQEAAKGPILPQTAYTVTCGAPNTEVEDLDDAQTGLTVSQPAYPGWQGPYVRSPLPNDPWGNPYFFDTDYDIAPTGDGKWAAVVGSYGPNGQGLNQYDSDDIILILSEMDCP